HDFVARLTSLVSGPGFLPEILDPPFPTIPTLTPRLPSIPPKPTLTRTVLLSRRPPNELCPALLTQLRLRLHRSPPNAQTNSSTRPTSPVAAQPARRSSSSRVTGHHPPSAWTPQSPPPDPGDAYAPPREAQRYAWSDPWTKPTRTSCTRRAMPDRTGPSPFRGSFSYLSCVVSTRRLPLNHPSPTVYTMNATPPTRIAGYIRISRLRDDSLSPDTQRRRITDWAAAHGHQVVAWYEDLSVSGKDLDRPGLERLRANWRLYDAAV